MDHRPGRITRTRPNLTCAPCRKRKVKCDKQKPACAQCERLDVKCFYDAATSSSSSSLSSSRPPPSAINFPTAPAEPQFEFALGLGPGLDHGHGRSHGPDTTDEAQGSSTAVQPAHFGLPPAPAIPPGHHDDHGMDWVFDPDLDSSFLGGPFLFNQLESQAAYLPTPPHVASTSTMPSSATTLPSAVSLQDANEPASSDNNSPSNGSHDPPSTGSQASSSRNHSIFWPRSGKENTDESVVLQQSRHRRVQLAFNQARWSKICAILQELPPKSACDELLQSFLLSVRPACCLVHVPTFLRDYNAFWEQHDRNTKMPEPHDAMRQASFFCLLWAVLFGGAAATSALTDYVEASPQDCDSPTSMMSLYSRFNETFALSRQTDLPTLHGLVSSLLVYECNYQLDEALDTPPLISQSLVAARALELQNEEKTSARGHIEGEIARRAWYYLLWIEAISVVGAGCSLSPISDTYTTRMPLDIGDAELEALDRHMGLGNPLPRPPSEQGASSSVIYHMGRSEAAIVFRSIVQKCWGTEPPSRQDLDEVASGVACLVDKLNWLTARLKVRGLPEEGQVSQRLFLAHDPATAPAHNDNPQDETNFNAFVRIMFRLYQGLIATQYTTFFLGPEGSVDAHASEVYASICRETRGFQARTGVVSLDLLNDCIVFLSSYLQLCRLPALAPYRWYIPRRLPPLQAALLMIGQMEHHPATPEMQQLTYLLEEAFEVFLHPDGSAKLPLTAGPDSWRPLLQRHQEIKARSNKTNDAMG